MEKSGKHRNLTEIIWANLRARTQQYPIYNMSEKINVSDLPPYAIEGQASRQSPSPYYRGLANTDTHIYGASALGGVLRQPHKQFIGIRQRPSGRWVAEINDATQKIRLWLGTFDTAEEAARAYDEAACLLYGPNTATNFRQRDPDSSNITNIALASSAFASNISNLNSSSSVSSSTPFIDRNHVIRYAEEENNFYESHFTDYECPSLGWDITQTHGGHLGGDITQTDGVHPDNCAQACGMLEMATELSHYSASNNSTHGRPIRFASPPNGEVCIDIIRLIENEAINYDKHVHYQPIDHPETFHELKMEQKARLVFDGSYEMMRQTTVALCGQTVSAVMTNAFASSSSSASSSSCAVWMSEIAVALGLCFIMAGISLREKRRDFSIMMTKFGAIATSWAIIISLGSHLPPVMGWAVATVAFFIVAASVAFA